MKVDDFLNKKGDQKYEVNIGVSILRLIELTNSNNIYLRSILKRHLELKEILNGKVESEYDEIVLEKFVELQEKISEISKTSYHKILDEILD